MLPPPARRCSTCSRGWISRRPCSPGSWPVCSGRAARPSTSATIRSACAAPLWRVPAIAAGAFALTGLAAFAAAPHAGFWTIQREAADLLLLDDGPIHFGDELGWVPLAVGRARRALAALDRLRGLPPAGGAAESSRRRPPAHGGRSRPQRTAPTRCPSSSFVATPTTSSRRTSVPSSATASRTACCSSPATRSGPRRLSPVCCARSAGSPRCTAWRSACSAPASAGCRSGARPGCGRSTSETRPSSTRTRSRSRGGRSGRFASRCRASRPPGTTCRLVDVADLDTAVLAELERVSGLWRDGAPERGFSMAMDSLRCEEHCAGTSRSPATPPARSAASSTSCPPTADRRCRCRRCVATLSRPTA